MFGCAGTVGNKFEMLRVSSPPSHAPWAGGASAPIPAPPTHTHQSLHQEPAEAVAMETTAQGGRGCKGAESLGAWNFPGSEVTISESIKIWVFVPSKTAAPTSSTGSGHRAKQVPPTGPRMARARSILISRQILSSSFSLIEVFGRDTKL